ncbi:SMAD/FHA domain [Pseudocohnilembus persalinus]|uniref:SMAD/FHA domain n=1 Tax=Pseudocohnilembus persalinus TaxID=266149 RepID=A0A0V0R1U4_PSEPJ|nr:SMAD/FHA domain [Pseudocohnilembus persalinus]|eukprot:KRX08503.1 SMAD/FHA domain [Pseudocohnilembus persalinus]
MSPKCLQIVELPKFLYFYETTWGIPSQRLSIMNHKFSLPEEVHMDSSNECLQLTVIKSPSRTISLLQKQAMIKLYQTHIEIQNGSQQYLKQISQCIFGTDQEKCDIVFPWTSDISPQHLKIGQSSQGYWIKDISKLNRSVFVMQKNQQYQLQGNSVVQFGLDDKFLISYVRPVFTPDSQQYRDATQVQQQELYSDFNLDQNYNKEGSDNDNNEYSNQNQGLKSKQNKTFYFDPDVKDLEITLKKYKEIKFNNSYIQKSNVKDIEKNNDFSDDDFDLAMINQKGPLLRMKGLQGQYKDQILEFDQGIYTFGTDESNKFVFKNPSVSKDMV